MPGVETLENDTWSYRNTGEVGDRPIASLLLNQLCNRVDMAYIATPLVRRAVAIVDGSIAALSTRFSFVNIQRPSIKLVASKTGNGRHCLVLFRHFDERCS